MLCVDKIVQGQQASQPATAHGFPTESTTAQKLGLEKHCILEAPLAYTYCSTYYKLRVK